MPASKLQERLIAKAVGKLAPAMLDKAGEALGNNGCNDFDFDEYGLSRAEQEAFVMFMNDQNKSPEETPDAIKALPMTHDFGVAYACAAWLRKETT